MPDWIKFSWILMAYTYILHDTLYKYYMVVNLLLSVAYDCLINDVMCVIIRIVVIVNTACCDSCTIVIIVILNTYATQQLATRMAERAPPLLGSMDIFNPDVDDWSAYVERLELFFLANEIRQQEGRCSDNCYRHQSLQFAAKHTRTSKSR